MSTRRPPARGPLPSSVYWRRRAVLAGTALILVVSTVDLVNGDDAPPRESAVQVAGTPTAPPSDPAVVIGPRRGRRHVKRNQPSAPVSPPPPTPPPAQPTGICADGDVVVTPVMAPAVAGSPVLITLLLRTRETEACTWTIGRDHLAYRIIADGDVVWSSNNCPGQVPQDVVVVRRALTQSYRLAWNGRLSSRDCPVSMSAAEPGDYAVQASAIGGEPSAPVPFTLVDPAGVVPSEPAGPPVPAGVRSDSGRGQKEGHRAKRRSRRE